MQVGSAGQAFEFDVFNRANHQGYFLDFNGTTVQTEPLLLSSREVFDEKVHIHDNPLKERQFILEGEELFEHHKAKIANNVMPAKRFVAARNIHLLVTHHVFNHRPKKQVDALLDPKAQPESHFIAIVISQRLHFVLHRVAAMRMNLYFLSVNCLKHS